MSTSEYVGNELELFAEAKNWKNYWAEKVAPYVKGEVLEVGAGIGGTTAVLIPKCTYTSWLSLEPDKNLAEQIKINKDIPDDKKTITILNGLITDIPKNKKFDTIIYIDVIEHIEDDRQELKLAHDRLKPEGILIVLVPAHNWLFSPFDKAVGHYRRYNKSRLKSSVPEMMKKERLFYLDSGGLIASIFNKLWLKQSIPTKIQINLWDRLIVPFSKISDVLIGFLIGKSLIGIWKKL